MSQRTFVPPLPTRMSARQAQRRSAPKPRTPRISESQGRWIIGGTKSDERKLLEKIVEYLHVDPLRDGDSTVLRFLLKEWKMLQPTLHTIDTMDSLKHTLLAMGIPYLRKMVSADPTSTRAKKWEYWNDYTTAGIEKFHAENTIQGGTTADSTTGAKDNSLSITDELDMEADEGNGDNMEADKGNGDNSDVSIDDTSTESAKTGSGFEDDASYTNPMGLRTTPSPELQSQPLIDEEAMPPLAEMSTAPGTTPRLPGTRETMTPIGADVEIPTATPMKVWDTDGNTVIDLQAIEQRNQRRRDEAQQVRHITRQLLGGQENDSPLSPTALLKTLEGILTERIHDAVTSLDTRQKVWKQTILQLQSQVHDQERILQERMRHHEHRILKAETSLSEWEKMLLDHEDRLDAKEQELVTRLQDKETAYIKRLEELDRALDEKQSERILADGSEWEDHIAVKFEEHFQSVVQRKYQQLTEDASGRYEQRHEDISSQRGEKRTKAWMEVASTQTLDKLSTSLKAFHDVQRADIDEFFKVAQMNLQQDLDEFQYHAQETLHAGIFGEGHPNPRARHAAPPSRAIAVEAEEDATGARQAPESPTMPTQERPPVDPTTPPSRTAVATPPRQSRWKNVDVASLLSSHGNTADRSAHRAQSSLDTTQPAMEDRHPVTADKGRKPNAPSLSFSATTGGRNTDVSQEQRTETAENYIARLRKTPTPMQLRGQQRQAVVTWYNSFVDFLKTYRVPIKIFDEFHVHKLDDPTEVLYPSTLGEDPHMYDRYSAAIYARLEEDQVLDPDNQVYMGLLRLHNSTRDGYSVLKSILAATLLADIRNISVLSTPPTAAPGTDPFLYAASLKEFFSHQAQLERHYHHKEQATMYLQAMQQQPKYTAAATQMLHDLEQLKLAANNQDLPTKYGLSQLPVAMVTHQGVLRAEPPTATLNVTQLTRPASDHGNDTLQSSDYRHGTPRTPRQPQSRMRNPQGTNGMPRSRYQTPARPEVQCTACSTNGHTAEVCKILPRVHSCMEYIAGQPTQASESLRQYRKTNHPMTKRQNKERLVNVLLGEINHRQTEGDGWWEHVADIVDTVAEQYHDEYYDDHEEYLPSIHQTHVYKNAVGILSPPYTLEKDLDRFVQPIQYPPLWELNTKECFLVNAEDDPLELLEQTKLMDKEPSAERPRTEVALPTSPPLDDEPCRITLITTRLDTRRDLADTGTTISATGIRSILHRFQDQSDYEIKGYDGQVTKAAGQGYACIYNPTSKQVDEMMFVYTPLVMGTIISLEHHARTHPRIHKWTQEATPSDDKGVIKFHAEDGTVVSEYPTIRSQGLYYIQDLKFIPAPVAPSPSIAPSLENNMEETVTMVNITVIQCHARPVSPLEDTDYTPEIDREHFAYLLGDQQTPANTICVATTGTAYDNSAVRATQQYELWHQRFGHAPASRLYHTSKHVTGLPPISPTSLPTFIRCRACDIAKLKKAPRGHAIEDPADLQTGQHFSMDLGFMRGPANLQAVVARLEDALPKVITSRQGYTCYLLIMDRKSRYTWAFPLKSRSVSTDLMTIFLQTHGNSTAQPKMIRTDGEGAFAESIIFRNLVAKERFILQKTATDTSSQNGTAERPHQSLGNMVRCMLYAAAMPVEFWADALVYAVYVTNRLHHSGINAVPYSVWTGKQPNVSNLRIFGAHVTVRRSGMRPTKLDPHFFTGRFLRFGATAKNLLYYDDVTHRVKMARHCSMDELHYGTKPLLSPPMANAIIQQTLPPRVASTLPEDTLLRTDDTAPLLTELDTMHPASCDLRDSTLTTAVAAAMYTSIPEQKRQMERVLALESTTHSFGPPIRIVLPMNQLPTLGLILQDTQTTTTVVGCQEGTAASRLPRWRSQFKDATIRSVGAETVRDKATFAGVIATLRQRRTPLVHIILARHEVPELPIVDMPQLHYDQLKHINHLQNRCRQRTAKHKECKMMVIMTLSETIMLTRSQLKKRSDYQQWRLAEWTQHNKYKTQNMFGNPIKRPHGATVLPFV